MKTLIIPFTLLALFFMTTNNTLAQDSVSKYEPGFTFYDIRFNANVTLIRWVNYSDEIPESILEYRSKLGFTRPYPPMWGWKAKQEGIDLELNYDEKSIDLCTGKAFRYKDRIIYYDSDEDCISKNKTP